MPELARPFKRFPDTELADLTRFVDARNERTLLRYFRSILTKHGYLTQLGLAIDDEDGAGPRPIALESLYVAPRLSPQALRPADLLEAEQQGRSLQLESIADVLKAEPRLFILGDPGTGKSTLVQQLMLAFTTSDDNHIKRTLGNLIPFIFVLRELHLSGVSSWRSLWEAYLEADRGRAEVFGGGNAAALLSRLLSSGQALLLVDGLDEVRSMEERNAVIQGIRDGFARFPAARWVITSRIVGFAESDWLSYGASKVNEASAAVQIKQAAAPAFHVRKQELALEATQARELPVAYLAPLQHDQVEAFARNWFRSYLPDTTQQSERVRDLLGSLRNNAHVDSLARVPVMLNMICFIQARRGRLPDGRTELYERVALTYLSTLDRARGLKYRGRGLRFDYNDFCRWLGSLAFRMQAPLSAERRVTVRESELRAVLLEGMQGVGVAGDDASDEARLIIGYLAERSGLVLPRGKLDGEEQYGFAHLSLQEYFLARYLCDQIVDPDFAQSPANAALSWGRLQELAHVPAWHEAIALLFELLPGRWPGHALERIFPLDEAVGASGDLASADMSVEDWRSADLLSNIVMNSAVRLGSDQRGRAIERLWQIVVRVPFERYARTNDSDVEIAAIVARLCSDQYGSWKILPEVARQRESLSLLAFPEPGLDRISDQHQLKKISFRGARTIHLDAMREMHLVTHLDFSKTGVADLLPLQQLVNLEILSLQGTPVSDLSPLLRLRRLRQLHLDGTSVSDIGALAELYGLRLLFLMSTGVSDLAPLSELRQLRFLGIGNTPVADLTPLCSMNDLSWLTLDRTKVSDIEPLVSLTKLRTLSLWNTRVRDFTPLSSIRALEDLDLDSTALSDLTPLSPLTNLITLSVASTRIEDLSPLAELYNLATLDASRTRVRDLDPLSGLSKLKTLSLDDTSTTDLRALSSLHSLEQLSLRRTPVVDITPLANLENLKILDLSETDVADVSSVAGRADLVIRR